MPAFCFPALQLQCSDLQLRCSGLSLQLQMAHRYTEFLGVLQDMADDEDLRR